MYVNNTNKFDLIEKIKSNYYNLVTKNNDVCW